MRKNEYTSIEDFTSQYTGVWAPSEGHWLGLDFMYNGKEYRFHTGSMYDTDPSVLPDGREAMFGLYQKCGRNGPHDYILLEEFASIDDVLNSTCIEGKPFKEIIVEDSTELLGQD
jgi:hypothetical protein